MKNRRAKIDTFFESIGRTIFRHRFKSLLMILLFSAALISQLTHFRADFSYDKFFHPGDPTLENFNRFRDQFGNEESIVVIITPDEVFDTEFLQLLTDLHRRLEDNVPYLEDMTSLVNARYTYSKGDQLLVEDLLEVIPETSKDLADLKNRVLSSRLYPNLLISPDGKSTVILLRLYGFTQIGTEDSNEESFEFEDSAVSEYPKEISYGEISEAVAATRRILKDYKDSNLNIYLTGGPVIGDFFETNILQEQIQLLGIATVAFTILLLLLFRRISGVFIPLLIIFLSLAGTFGLMGVFDAPFAHPTSILPIFLLAVGIGDSVHLLAIFYRQYRESGDKENSMVFAMGHSGLPVLMTSLTTAAGFYSFSTAGILHVANLGIFGGLGVLLALVYTVLLIPTLIAILPVKAKTMTVTGQYGSGFDKVLASIAEFSTRKAWSIVWVSVVFVGFCSFGLTWQKLAHNTNDWLPHDSEFRESLDIMDRQFGGSSSLEVVIDTKVENGLYNPEIITKIEKLETYADAYRNKDGSSIVGKADSILNVLKETNQSLNQNNPDFYTLPNSRELIAQELLLFENSGSDDMEPLVDSQLSKARLSLKTQNEDASTYMRFVETMEKKADDLFGNSVEVVYTGAAKIFAQIMHMMVVDMAKSYLIAGVVITILMMLFLSSFRLGLISIIPNVLPIVTTLGVLGWLGIHLDMANMLLGTIAIGLAVDDTIHFLHNFKRYYAISGNSSKAVRETMHTSGRAMLFTTLILVTGFVLYLFSAFPPLYTFGIALGSTLVTALLADILLVPAILEIASRKKRSTS